MSEKNTSYNWLDINPSQEVDLPYIDASVYEPGGSLYWLKSRSDSQEQLLQIEQDNLHLAYPLLFEQIELLAPYTAGSDDIIHESEAYEFFYMRGVTLTLLSLEASLAPGRHIKDISQQYMNKHAEQSGIDTLWWLHSFHNRDSGTTANTKALRDFIMKDYRTIESFRQTRPILAGARNAFTIAAHYLACYEREVELSKMCADDDLFEGWLAYRSGEY